MVCCQHTNLRLSEHHGCARACLKHALMIAEDNDPIRLDLRRDASCSGHVLHKDGIAGQRAVKGLAIGQDHVERGGIADLEAAVRADEIVVKFPEIIVVVRGVGHGHGFVLRRVNKGHGRIGVIEDRHAVAGIDGIIIYHIGFPVHGKIDFSLAERAERQIEGAAVIRLCGDNRLDAGDNARDRYVSVHGIPPEKYLYSIILQRAGEHAKKCSGNGRRRGGRLCCVSIPVRRFIVTESYYKTVMLYIKMCITVLFLWCFL